MIDKDVLLEKINSIQNCLQRIHDVTKHDKTDLHDLNVQDVLVLNLQRAIQLCLDIASYIVANQKLGLPQTLKDNFLILAKNSVLTSQIAEKMGKMVGFRNIAVYAYQALNIDILRNIVKKHLPDFETYYKAIASKYLQSNL